MANGPNTPGTTGREGARGQGPAPERPTDTAAADAARAAGSAAERTMGAERRTFQEGAASATRAAASGMNTAEGIARQSAEATRQLADNATRAASSGLSTAEDIARQGAEATRQLADDGRRVGMEIANAWREAWNPFFKAHMEATRWLDQTWRQLTGLGAFPALQTARPFAISPAPLFGAPPADVRETDGAYEIAIETPGMARENLDLKLEGDVLTVSGQKLDGQDQATSTYRVSERRFGRFARSFPIPPDARREAIEASHKDGLLTIRMPKSEPDRSSASRVEIR